MRTAIRTPPQELIEALHQLPEQGKAEISDYFSAGTLGVWDVDVLRQKLIRVSRASDPDHPASYRRGDIAEAEPALPGWRLPVDAIFE